MIQTHSQATVFGGSGFLGRHIVHRLAHAGYQIKIPCRNLEKALLEKTSGTVGQIVPFACDLQNDGQLQAALQGSSVVINLIGILQETRKNSFRAWHTEWPLRLSAAASASGVQKLVHVSALGANINHPSAYMRSKAYGEIALSAIFPAATIMRPSVVFGPEDNFYNQFARMAWFSPVLPLIGDGVTRFQPVYVGDVAAAVLAALQQPAAAGKIYELGGPAIYSLREIIEYVLTVTQRQRILMRLPWPLAKIMATVFEQLPITPLTRDQVTLLRSGDNILTDQYSNLADLGVIPTAVEAIVPDYLITYRQGGRYAR